MSIKESDGLFGWGEKLRDEGINAGRAAIWRRQS